MTTRPRLVSIDRSMWTGLAALALFVVIAAVALSANFGELTASFGFDAGRNIVGSIGAALVGIDPAVFGEGAVPVESFLVALIVIAVALDAALDGAIMLATRDEEPEETATDGGER
jgi:NADH-quinone oxidoreductase subunit J